MDKAMHSEFEGHKSEWDEILRGNDAKRFMEIMKSSKPLSEAEIKRIRENYERMAKIESPDLLKENQSLRSELQKLQQWKKEQMQVWGPVLDYMQKHPELSLGESISKRVLEFLKEREKQKELNAELVDVLEMFFEKDRIPAVHGAMPVALRSFRERAEDLIKKSKES